MWFIRPWVDRVRDGRIIRARETKIIGMMGNREAIQKKNEIMATINRADCVITAQINFGRFTAEYEKLHVEKLAASRAPNTEPI